MNYQRQDGWHEDEDRMLKETVLQFITEGKTQLQAFQEVARQLGRTPAACGFRWNAALRKQHADEVREAKQKRKQKKDPLDKMFSSHRYNGNYTTLEAVISAIESMHREAEKVGKLSEENKQLKREVERLRQENGAFKEDVSKLEEKERTLQEDYDTLLKIMERARQLSSHEVKEELGRER